MPVPAVEAYLDDGTGTWPYNITAYVDLQAGIGIARGRQDENGQVDASTCSLTLSNLDGRFTPGKASPVYPIDVDTPIRVRVQKPDSSWSNRFTGYVNTWPVEWPNGGKMSTLSISANDRLARLARRTLPNTVNAEFLRDAPAAYYPMTEPAGSTMAYSSAMATQPPLTIKNGASGASGAAPVFGVTGPPANTPRTAVSFSAGANVDQGKYLSAKPTVAAGAFTLECYFAGSPAAMSPLMFAYGVDANRLLGILLGPTGLTLQVTNNPAGLSFPQVAVPSTSAANNGSWHHVAITIGSTNDGSSADTVNVYFDGTLVLTQTTRMQPLVTLAVGGSLGLPGGLPMLTGSVAHVALTPGVLPVARIASHAAVAVTGLATESSELRVQRIAGYANIPVSATSTETGQSSVPGQVLSGASPLDAMRDVETTEAGLLFVDGSGQLVFQARSHRWNRAADVTLTADGVGVDTTFVLDNQNLVNYITATREADTTAATQVVQDTASIALYEQYAEDLSMVALSDQEVFQAASWRIATRAKPVVRINQTTVDLLTQTSAIKAAMLGLELGGVLALTGLPSQAPASTASLYVEGWEERISAEEWSMNLNTSPTSPYSIWVLQSGTYGAINSTWRLAY